MEVIVNLHGGRPTARADALHFFKRKHSVRGGLLVADAQFALQWSKSSSPPRSMQQMFVHTCTLNLPRA